MFFSPEDFELFPPCGMFNLTHLIVTLSCLLIVGLLIYLTMSWTHNKINKLTKTLAIVFTILELIKMGYNFYYGYLNVDSWVPLAFCSLFIYGLWCSGYGKGVVKVCGDAFITGGGIVCGFSFLIMPSTSLQLHPMFHYLSCYSMLFHSAMFFMGLLYLIHKVFIPSIKNYRYYIIFSLIFMIMAIIVNLIFKSNLMFLDNPYAIPVELVKKLGEYKLPYMIAVILVYIIVPYFVSYGLHKLISFKKAEVKENASL